MFDRDLNVCPRCGERVTAFAAGCSYCGATLDQQRFRRQVSTADRVRGWARRATARPGRSASSARRPRD
ncbi:hypothetical protein PAI11_26380 [Patulibacter medicamentivorans]|uniref:Zinc-ribbon domain-containing protein n=1 Tax=Patulibacter medicamentivorans TaxID=1097667 RepID=H0E736_9ACTN|nr:hypothetical protein [Patulibacter medicamentivorans]EHN10531.1 hypothetical protein PAI11_26380 [Patulibacter medicamentivorans]